MQDWYIFLCFYELCVALNCLLWHTSRLDPPHDVDSGADPENRSWGANKIRGHIACECWTAQLAFEWKVRNCNTIWGGSGGPPPENFENLPPKWCIWGRPWMKRGHFGDKRRAFCPNSWGTLPRFGGHFAQIWRAFCPRGGGGGMAPLAPHWISPWRRRTTVVCFHWVGVSACHVGYPWRGLHLTFTPIHLGGSFQLFWWKKSPFR